MAANQRLTVFGYITGPIDHWIGTTPLELLLHEVEAIDKDRCEDLGPGCELFPTIRDELMLLRQAICLIGEHHYGDCKWRSDESHVGCVPDPNGACTDLWMARKLDNNGTCVFASQYPMPWLVEPDNEHVSVLTTDKLEIFISGKPLTR